MNDIVETAREFFERNNRPDQARIMELFQLEEQAADVLASTSPFNFLRWQIAYNNWKKACKATAAALAKRDE